MRHARPLIALGLCFAATAASAENVTWKYDALGRLTQAFRADGPAAGTLTTIAYDATDNRTSYKVVNTVKTLATGAKIYSADTRFYLTLQANGQLALVKVAGPVTLWTSGTTTQTANQAKFGTDGNLAILTAASAILWSTNTAGNPAAQLTLQNDGNLTITSNAGAQLWHTNTGGN